MFWTHFISSPEDGGGLGSKHQAPAVITNPAPAGPWSAWAVGDQAKMVETEDGGITWTTKNTSKGTFYSVAFPTRLSGWVVGSGGAIFHTDDGGATWSQQGKGLTTDDLSEVAFVEPNIGWIVGDGGTVLHTEDAGSTWKPRE